MSKHIVVERIVSICYETQTASVEDTVSGELRVHEFIPYAGEALVKLSKDCNGCRINAWGLTLCAHHQRTLTSVPWVYDAGQRVSIIGQVNVRRKVTKNTRDNQNSITGSQTREG